MANSSADGSAPFARTSDRVKVVSPEQICLGYSDALARGLCVVIDHHGASSEIQKNLTEQIKDYLKTSDTAVWFKRAKYLLTQPMSVYLKNELPTPPPGPTLKFSGPFNRWMRPRIKSFNRRNTHLWYSWLQAKRGADALDMSIVQSTYDKHFETLTREDHGDEELIDEILRNPAFDEVLTNSANAICKKLEHSKDYKEFSGSTSACFEMRRLDGGQAGLLRGVTNLLLYEHSISTTILLNMEDRHGVLFRGRRISTAVIETRSPDLFYQWGELDYRSEERFESGNIACSIQAVLEPLKVRVISKGQGLPYYRARVIQRAMHDTLRDQPWFRLIGRPMCPTDLMDLRKKAKPGDMWNSIDYSAATDGLSWRYSRAILIRLLLTRPKELDLALRVLGPHDLWYPVRRGKKLVWEFRGIQQNGQLMGSILSFPILCLANLGLCLYAKRGSTADDFLINGDDAAYVGDEETWARHVELGKRVGLEMSVGKAYRHRSYVNINSTCFHYDLNDSDSTPWQIDFLNVGLIRGQGKVLEKRREELGCAEDHRDDLTTYVSNINRILEGSLPGRECRLLAKILSEHHKEISDECKVTIQAQNRLYVTSRNLFLPKSVGGMGVRAPPGFKWEVRRSDQLIAYECAPPVYLVGDNPWGIRASSPYLPPWSNRKVKLREKIVRVSKHGLSELISKRNLIRGLSPFYGKRPSEVVDLLDVWEGSTCLNPRPILDSDQWNELVLEAETSPEFRELIRCDVPEDERFIEN